MVGPNGIGKSTFLNLLLGKVEPVSYLLSCDDVKTTRLFVCSLGIGRNQEKSSIGKHLIIPTCTHTNKKELKCCNDF